MRVQDLLPPPAPELLNGFAYLASNWERITLIHQKCGTYGVKTVKFIRKRFCGSFSPQRYLEETRLPGVEAIEINGLSTQRIYFTYDVRRHDR